MRAWFVVFAAACRFQDGAATDGGFEAGSDGDADADAPPDVVGPPGDVDGDGVPDASDNCPAVANADQHDEDADAAGDRCDPCPQIANAVSDGDGDGIADACDPHPANPGDQLVAFDSFSTPGALPTGWMAAAGAANEWSRTGDALVVDAGATTLMVVRDAGSAQHAIDVGFNVTSAMSGQSFVTPLTDASSTAQSFVACGIRIDTDYRQYLQCDSNQVFTALDGTDSSEALTVPGSYRVVSILPAMGGSCAVPGAQGQHLMTSTRNAFGNTYVGLRVMHVHVAFRYVAIYRF